ncbi:MAG: hypothetical protein IPP91_05060 [Betaproteobacteria bacterium]|nr:hypothetical protein [Betaproteobacteria bacterium]
MASNRRAFLQFAGLAPAAAAAGLVSTATARAASSGQLTRSTFLPCVGDEFLFEGGPFEAMPAKLVRIEGLAQGGATLDGEGTFRLLFEPEAKGAIAQESYRVSHARLGRFTLFVSPNDAEGRVVEAVFNRP